MELTWAAADQEPPRCTWGPRSCGPSVVSHSRDPVDDAPISSLTRERESVYSGQWRRLVNRSLNGGLALMRTLLRPLVLVIVLGIAPPSAAMAADRADALPTTGPALTLQDGVLVVLEPVAGRTVLTAASAGSATAGCRLTAYNYLGWVIYSYTIWQEFSYNGVAITYFPSESTSSVAYWGWALTSDRHSHWWVRYPYSAAAKGEYTFTQYIAGQPFQSRSGWVQVNISGDGSWSCRAG